MHPSSKHMRVFARRVLIAPLWAAALVAAPALGNVMEISKEGHSWIAGGPAASVQTPEDQKPSPPAITPGITEVTSSAGPRQWQARIAKLAEKYDLSPALLEAVVWQESRWNEFAVSPAGAFGLAQLMPDTATSMGVNAYDPYANLEGGARYLRMQLDAFDGNLEKALAAYNAGPGRVARAGGIPAIRETRQYVASVLSRLSKPNKK